MNRFCIIINCHVINPIIISVGGYVWTNYQCNDIMTTLVMNESFSLISSSVIGSICVCSRVMVMAYFEFIMGEILTRREIEI